MITIYSWLALGVAAFAAWIVTPKVIALSKRFGLVDNPQNKRVNTIHETAVPRGGGAAIFIAIVVAMLLFLPFDQITASILLSLLIITTYGLLDDKYNLNPYVRLGLQILVASIVVGSGVKINFTTNPLTNGVLNLVGFEHPLLRLLPFIFSVFWIVFLMNVLNMGAKGVDGQLNGVIAISALVIAILSQKYSADIALWPVGILSLVVAGAFIGTMPWTIYPQKIMPSFSGSNIGGFMLGVLSILSTAKVGTLLVTLGLPIIDTAYVVLRRISQKKSPVWGDRGHLHHRLLDAGIKKKNITYIYWLSTALLGSLALNLNATSKIYTIIGVSFLLGGLTIFLTRANRKQDA